MICCVVGLGYVGLPIAGLLADTGLRVVGYDIDVKKVSEISEGKIFAEEKDVRDIVMSGLHSKNLTLSTKVVKADVYLICVPTPLIPTKTEFPKPDIDHVLNAAHSIGKVADLKSKIIIESTCPVGTTEIVKKTLLRDYNLDLMVYYCPERVLPGNTIYELKNNSRIVGVSKKGDTAKDIISLYKNFVKAEILITDAKVAEMVKIVENSYRDLNIAFANQLQSLCNKLSVDCKNMISLANCHPRVNILDPGIGVGGHCIPIDPWFLISVDPNISSLSIEARRVNLNAVQEAIRKILEVISEFKKVNNKSPLVALFGLSYKPDIADFRESPALLIMQKLQSVNIKIIAVQPKSIAGIFDNIIVDYNDALIADIAVKLVDHSEFREIINENYISNFETYLDLTK